MDVLDNRFSCIIFRSNWICRCEDSSSGVELTHDTGFGNRDGLLLHGLMEDGTAIFVHFVELIDAADTLVREDNGTRLQDEFLGLGVFGDVRGQTHS